MLIVVKQMRFKDTEEHGKGNLPLLRNGELDSCILALCLNTWLGFKDLGLESDKIG